MAIFNMVGGGKQSGIQYPLTAVSNLAVSAGNTTATVTFTDTTDLIVSGYTIAEYQKSVLVRKAGSAPSSVSDGTTIGTYTTKGASVTKNDTGLTNGTTYYYRVFSYATNGQISMSSAVSVVPVAYRTFTVSWTEASSPSSFNPVWSDDAIGLTAGSSAFDDFFGYSGVRLNANGQETGTVNLASMSTQSGLTSGDNVMVKFPRRGIKMSKSGSTITLSITDDPNKAGFQYYAFTRGNVAKDQMYLGAYKASFNGTKLQSLSGKAPGVNQTIATFRTYAHNAGTGYDQITWYARNYINALYMMKYGNPDSQTVIGRGYVDGNSAAVNTGGTNSRSGATWGETTGKQQAKLFGLEDRWGNVYEWLDGCYYDGSTRLTTSLDNSSFADSAYSHVVGTSASGYMTAAYGTNDGMFANKTAGGSNSTYYCDYVYADASRVLCAGGDWGAASDAGAFRVDYAGASTASAFLGGRLMFL